jgi:hypothetical protein
MAKRLTLLAAVVVAPSLAGAQITITESNDQDLIVNVEECLGTTVSDTLSFTWNFPQFTTAGTYTLTASDTNGCPASTSTQAVRNVTLGTVPAASAAGSFPASTSNAVVVSTLLPKLGIPTSCNSPTTSVSICVTLDSAPNATPVTALLNLDLAFPPAPTVTSVAPGDSSLRVNWTRGSEGGADAGTPGTADSYKITATSQADPNDTHTTDFISPGSQTNGRVDGLKNGVTYDVTVQAFSRGRNPSPVSNKLSGIPVQVNDFWRLYRSDGGREEGGCAAGAAGMLALLAVPLALRTLRRRS